LSFIKNATVDFKNGLQSWVNDGNSSNELMSTLAEPEIVTRKGKPVSVILPIKDYEELLERSEDADDAAWLEHARRKPLCYRPLADYLAGKKSKSRV
jgi:hypothetical protein